MAPTTEFGPVREIWLAPLDSPSTKSSFLIRDDAYSRGGAVYGRTIRLGEPVNLGPNSTWRQKSWEGGRGQKIWNDEAMYDTGFLDVSDDRGRVKLWPNFNRITGNADANNYTGYAMTRGVVGSGVDTPLYGGECDRLQRGTNVGGIFKAVVDASDNITTSSVPNPANSSVNAIAPLNDGGSPTQYLFAGCQNGKLLIINTVANTTIIAGDHSTANPVYFDSIVAFAEGLFYLTGKDLYRRIWTPSSPGEGTFNSVKFIPNCLRLAGIAVWNSRIWFGAERGGGSSDIYVSDGTTTVQAFTMDDFVVTRMVAHYGSLYLLGWRSSAKQGTGVVGEVWRYSGSSLTKLYQEGTGLDNENHFIWDGVSWGRYLVWSRPGFTTTGRRPGVMLYDAETDSIIDGPCFEMDPNSSQVQLTNIVKWNNTLAIAACDFTTYSSPTMRGPVICSRLRRDGGVRHKPVGGYNGKSFDMQAATLSRLLTSSRFDGDLPGENKTWLGCRLRVKIPASGCRIRVCVLLDESTTEKTLTTISHTGANVGWRSVTVPLKDSDGSYLKSGFIQYRFYLENTDSGNVDSTANPEIDSVEVDYMPSPTKRRQYRIRTVCADGQERLDGTANPLTTTQAMRDKLEEFYGAAEPLLFWDAGATGGVPGGAGTEVFIQEWLDQPYRVDSENPTVNAEVSLSLVEVVNS